MISEGDILKEPSKNVTRFITGLYYNPVVEIELRPRSKTNEKKYPITANCLKGQDAKQAG